MGKEFAVAPPPTLAGEKSNRRRFVAKQLDCVAYHVSHHQPTLEQILHVLAWYTSQSKTEHDVAQLT
jgi:hypothetical protein